MSSFTFHCMHYLCFCFQKLMIFVNSDLLFIANILYINKIQRYGYMFIFEILHIELMYHHRFKPLHQLSIFSGQVISGGDAIVVRDNTARPAVRPSFQWTCFTFAQILCPPRLEKRSMENQ